jgi:murein DD-endopeptidase
LELRRGPVPVEAAKPLPGSKLPPQMVALLGVPVDLSVPVPPAAFLGGDGKTHLVYELHITNFSPFELHVKEIEVSGANGMLARLEGTDLNALLTRPGSTDHASDRRTIGQGQRAVAFLWITLEPNAPVPAVLRHRLTVDDYAVGISVAVAAAPSGILSPPLRGAGWLAVNGPSNSSGHRRALMPMEGKAHDAQRFAIDWVKQDAEGKTFTGDAKDNKNYHAYGQRGSGGSRRPGVGSERWNSAECAGTGFPRGSDHFRDHWRQPCTSRLG